MQAQQAPGVEFERAIMSAVDLSGNPEEIMLAAVYLAQLGHRQRALNCSGKSRKSNPLRPEPYIQGLRAGSATERHRRGPMGRNAHLASSVAERASARAGQSGRKLAQATLKELTAERSRAGRGVSSGRSASRLLGTAWSKFSWTGDADIDLMVEEPAGTVCSLRNQRTTVRRCLAGRHFAHSAGRSGRDAVGNLRLPRRIFRAAIACLFVASGVMSRQAK